MKCIVDYKGGQILSKIMNLYTLQSENDKPNFNLIRKDFIKLLKLYGFRYVDMRKYGRLTCLVVKHQLHGVYSIVLDSYFDIDKFVDTSANMSLSTYLRTQLSEWKIKSIRNCNYKCALTGGKFDAVHHLHSFNLIMREIEDLVESDIYQSVLDIDEKELGEIVALCHELHDVYPLGVCLNGALHTLFHQQYGYGDNTPKQFNEFKTRLKIGEFNNFLEENNLELII